MRKQGLNVRVLLSLAALVIAVGAVAVFTTAGSGGTGSKAAAAGDGFEAAGVLTPIRQAPPLALHDYLGHPVNIDSYRGRAVLVTFLYTHCPDICPLITSQLRVAQNLMGPAKSAKAQIIAVSVDPRGDTPSAVASFLARHGMTGRMEYLTGSAHELAPVWKAWKVSSEPEPSSPQFVNHSGLVYGVSGSGKLMTVYAASFQPSEIAHDVPLLAAR